MAILIPISPGELLDRISILELKAARVVDRAARENVKSELGRLRDIRDAAGLDLALVAQLRQALEAANRRLWRLEDDLRTYERANRNDARVVACALAIRSHHDVRASLKRMINERLGSTPGPEKVYPPGEDDDVPIDHID